MTIDFDRKKVMVQIRIYVDSELLSRVVEENVGNGE